MAKPTGKSMLRAIISNIFAILCYYIIVSLLDVRGTKKCIFNVGVASFSVCVRCGANVRVFVIHSKWYSVANHSYNYDTEYDEFLEKCQRKSVPACTCWYSNRVRASHRRQNEGPFSRSQYILFPRQLDRVTHSERNNVVIIHSIFKYFCCSFSSESDEWNSAASPPERVESARAVIKF